MELHQIRYFVAVAETGNFTRAARRCFVSQPSLSQQIQKLEDELGKRLFDRLGRRAELTASGQAFLERARRILQDVDDATRAVQNEADAGMIRLGIVPTVAPYLVPELLSRLRSEQPGVQFNILEDFRSYLVEQIVAGKLDAAILTLPPDDPRLESETLVIEPLVVALSARHPLAAKKELAPSDLDGQRLVLLGDSSSLALQARRFFGEHKLNIEVAGRCAQVKTVKILVAGGVGVAILPQMATGRDQVAGVAYRDVAGDPPRREIKLVRHRLRFHSRAEERFREVLRLFCTERYGKLPA